jgi:hypothetical protein
MENKLFMLLQVLCDRIKRPRWVILERLRSSLHQPVLSKNRHTAVHLNKAARQARHGDSVRQFIV